MFEPEIGSRVDTATPAAPGPATRWQRWASSPLGANALAIGEALLYLALIALVAWLWGTPEADFRYWGL